MMLLLLPQYALFIWTLASFINVMAFIHILYHNFKDTNTKLLWAFASLFIPLLGGIIYFIIGRKQIISNDNG
jgi:cellulose synthase/poly-beta-1,6-N-acetylglucosamine synthase-like glycosyltransferase